MSGGLLGFVFEIARITAFSGRGCAIFLFTFDGGLHYRKK